MAIPMFGKQRYTGFLDRTIVLQGATYKYQVRCSCLRIGRHTKNGR